jgi:hypothetical protein
MSNSDMPEDGDFAAYLERKTQGASHRERDGGPPEGVSVGQEEPSDLTREAERQTIADVLVQGEEPSEELLEELNVLEGAAPLSDEELEQQALQHPGEDGDPRTPE